jgi:ribosome-binding factor A
MSLRRLERVTELIHQEISKMIPLLKDPGLGFITILAVRLSADFKLAKVYYSVLGTEDEKRRSQEALTRAKPVIRGHLRSLENLNNAPDLMFVLDHSAEEAQKVLEVLSQLEKERASESKSSPDDKPRP